MKKNQITEMNDYGIQYVKELIEVEGTQNGMSYTSLFVSLITILLAMASILTCCLESNIDFIARLIIASIMVVVALSTVYLMYYPVNVLLRYDARRTDNAQYALVVKYLKEANNEQDRQMILNLTRKNIRKLIMSNETINNEKIMEYIEKNNALSNKPNLIQIIRDFILVIALLFSAFSITTGYEQMSATFASIIKENENTLSSEQRNALYEAMNVFSNSAKSILDSVFVILIICIVIYIIAYFIPNRKQIYLAKAYLNMMDSDIERGELRKFIPMPVNFCIKHEKLQK